MPGTIEQVTQNLDDMEGLVDQLLSVITAGDATQATLRTEVAALVAAANINQAAKDALDAKIDAAFDKSEATENKMRAAIPGVPPVGGTPLGASYADRASFDAAVTAYTGPERVTLDGADVKTGTDPALEYFSHSADGSVSNSGPTD